MFGQELFSLLFERFLLCEQLIALSLPDFLLFGLCEVSAKGVVSTSASTVTLTSTNHEIGAAVLGRWWNLLGS